MNGFDGRAVIVTGGSRGVGRVIAERFLGAGAHVLICGRRTPETLPRSGGREASFVAADVRDSEQVEAVVAACVDRHGRLDVLVNNAGGSPFVEAKDASASFTAKIIALNLTAPLVFATQAQAVMSHQDTGGVIVNIASVSGTRPSPGTCAYGAAKAGLLNATQTLAVEWAPKVRVTAITAGLLETEAADSHYGGPAGVARVAATVPMRRLGSPDDVADACLFVASDKASYLTGASLLLHGGGEWPAFLAAARGD